MFQAQETIKAAGKIKDEEMYKDIEYFDLIAKEFKMHGHWRETFTKEFGEKHLQVTKTEEPKVIYIRNNFIRVRFEGLKWTNFKKWLKNQPVLNIIVCK